MASQPESIDATFTNTWVPVGDVFPAYDFSGGTYRISLETAHAVVGAVVFTSDILGEHIVERLLLSILIFIL